MHFKYKIIDKFKVKEWEKLYHENSKLEKAYVAILISNTISFRTRDILLEINLVTS